MVSKERSLPCLLCTVPELCGDGEEGWRRTQMRGSKWSGSDSFSLHEGEH